MRWQKLKHLFVAKDLCPALFSHAANPVAVLLDNGLVRIYYNARDRHQRASIGYIDCQLSEQECTIIHVADKPILEPGYLGLFDDSGVSLGCVLKVQGRWWLYYLGWNLCQTVPWRNSIGLAVSDDGVTFERVSPAPVLDRNHHDPYSLSYPWVLVNNGQWHMWYGSNLCWGADKTQMNHVIKYAVSSDGIHWQPTGKIAVDLKDSGEVGLSKPCVIIENGIYKMWYAIRSEQYRIGYAESTDGVTFQRKDELVGLDVSNEGWDSEALCYPNVFEHQQLHYLLYCGNGYGKTGFGLARLME